MATRTDQIIAQSKSTGFTLDFDLCLELEAQEQQDVVVFHDELAVWLDAVLEEKVLTLPYGIVVRGFVLDHEVMIFEKSERRYSIAATIGSFESPIHYRPAPLLPISVYKGDAVAWIWKSDDGRDTSVANIDDRYLMNLIRFLRREIHSVEWNRQTAWTRVLARALQGTPAHHVWIKVCEKEAEARKSLERERTK